MAQHEGPGRHAFLVGSGILLSRLVGLVRQRVTNRYFGLSNVADVIAAALRIPNLLQTLLGEGVLSASFIPVYAKLLAEGDEEESDHVAGAIFALLALAASLIVLAGVLAAPYLIYAVAPGFHGAKRALTIQLVRILFPGLGLLVLSAWCLGILNSHHKFFLSYTAPVLWNLAIIATLIAFGAQPENTLAVTYAWGFVAGCALQFGVQVPVVLRVAPRLRPKLDAHSANVRQVIRNFVPVFVSRGVVQISGYVDLLLASRLGEGAVAGLTNAQTLYLLPVSLFGMSVSAAELPAMSRAVGDEREVAAQLRRRLDAGLRQIAFLIVPSAMGFLVLGGVMTAVLFQTGRFTAADSRYLWGILAGSAVGLLAQTMGRLYSSAYYALRDTRTPLRFAVVRIILTTGLGYLCSQPLPVWLGIEPRWGVAGLTASAGIAGWVEFVLLRGALNRRIGRTGLAPWFVARLWLAALVAVGAGWGVKLAMGGRHPLLYGLAVLIVYGLGYFALAWLLRIEECTTLLRRLTRHRRN